VEPLGLVVENNRVVAADGGTFEHFVLTVGTDKREYDRIYPAVIEVGEGSIINTS